MKLCEGRVAIVTGAGRGLGRAYAIMLAAQGAKVVVNDVGSAPNGSGGDATPAQEVVDTIRAAGGEAVINTSDVANWAEAKAMVDQAVESFGGLDILINNAGILRDRMLVNMTEEEWDDVVRVHLKGTFAPTHHAANYWRTKSKAGETVDARIINTTSHSGLFCNIGQANYAAAKAGIASFSIIAARELERLGIAVNVICPRANTRLTENLREYSPEEIERRKPEWIAALVTWLCSTEAKGISGRVFEAWGFGYAVAESWQHGPMMEASLDPATIGPDVRKILKFARANAGIDRNVWLEP
jgi:NAD(P)-dependent dehydrogenase (short-subunit alcohol dehydrogenase family)